MAEDDKSQPENHGAPATISELRRLRARLAGHSITTGEKANLLVLLGEAADEIERLQCQIRIDDRDRETGRQWRQDSSLDRWFPFSARELNQLRKAEETRLRRPSHRASLSRQDG